MIDLPGIEFDPETLNTIVRASILGLVSLLFYLLRYVFVWLRRIDEETKKVETNHVLVMTMIANLQSSNVRLQETMDDLLAHILESNKRRDRRKTDRG